MTAHPPALVAAIIECFVNNPDATMLEISKKYNVGFGTVTRMISDHYFGPRKDGVIITKPSSINQLITKTA